MRTRIVAITVNEIAVGMCQISISNIFTPIKVKITARPYCSKLNFSATPDNRKYIARRPKIANKFDVKTMKGSVVTAKIAGILSTAKITSLSSTIINTSSSGVA